jgi:hypothetical protein
MEGKLDLTFPSYNNAISTMELNKPSDYVSVLQRLANDDSEMAQTLVMMNQTFRQSMQAIRGDLAIIIKELNRFKAEVDSLQQRVEGQNAAAATGPLLEPIQQPQQGMQPQGYQSLFRQ